MPTLMLKSMRFLSSWLSSSTMQSSSSSSAGFPVLVQGITLTLTCPTIRDVIGVGDNDHAQTLRCAFVISNDELFVNIQQEIEAFEINMCAANHHSRINRL